LSNTLIFMLVGSLSWALEEHSKNQARVYGALQL